MDELAGFAGRGGALAAGGGDAVGADRAGGTVGIADFATGLEGVSVRAAVVAEVALAAAGGAAGRFASAGSVEAGLAVAVGTGRAALDALGAAELVGREVAALVDVGTDPEADEPAPDADDPVLRAEEVAPDPDEAPPVAVEPVLGADEAAPGADEPVLRADEVAPDPDEVALGADDPTRGDGAIVDTRAADGAEPVARGAAPAGVAGVGFGAGVFDPGDVTSADGFGADAIFRVLPVAAEPEAELDAVVEVGAAPWVEAELEDAVGPDAPFNPAAAALDALVAVDVAGCAAEREGGTGASSGPKSEGSRTGETQTPE